ncbi:hypothetical protein ACFTXM_09745 [Streptomyces sp. NPDC056930]|uniref:hypothetical protein n=1 Tax=Streptomyces sp. NPDC056930 TaxID=3345967 RepID=UPI00362B8093
MDIQTTKVRGKFFSVVRDGAPVIHITRKYLTRRMAEAAAKCWVAFHGGEHMPVYTLAVTPMAEGGKRDLPGEYATKTEAWKAVQETFFAEAVTVLEDGKRIGTFQWFRAGEEPALNDPGKVSPVRDLCRWARGGWVKTGVQAVGNGAKLGPYRFIRTVAL